MYEFQPVNRAVIIETQLRNLLRQFWFGLLFWWFWMLLGILGIWGAAVTNVDNTISPGFKNALGTAYAILTILTFMDFWDTMLWREKTSSTWNVSWCGSWFGLLLMWFCWLLRMADCSFCCWSRWEFRSFWVLEGEELIVWWLKSKWVKGRINKVVRLMPNRDSCMTNSFIDAIHLLMQGDI